MKAAASSRSVTALEGEELRSGTSSVRPRSGGLAISRQVETASLRMLPRSTLGETLSVSPVPATAGDYPDVHQFLLSLFHGPPPSEFQSQVDDPRYVPSDRLVLRRAGQLIGHVRLVPRQIQFGPARLPIASLCDLAVSHEYRGQGYGSSLLQAAERRMLETGVLFATLRTSQPALFLRHGWSVSLRHSYSVAPPNNILARLAEPETPRLSPLAHPPAPLNIRLWRHVEQAALQRLYEDNTRTAFGATLRDEDCWRWLIDRRAHDRIYVAIDGPDKLELDGAMAPIVGYAVMREGRILELMTSPQHPRAETGLLQRACQDAAEQDLRPLCFDGPPDHRLHQVFVEAGGIRCHHESDRGEVFLVKLFDPIKFLLQIAGLLHCRAQQAGLPFPCELGLRWDEQRCCLSLDDRSVQVCERKLGRSYVASGLTEFTQMLMGHLHVPAAAEAGRLTASTRAALETASILFPRLPLWCPAWDDPTRPAQERTVRLPR